MMHPLPRLPYGMKALSEEFKKYYVQDFGLSKCRTTLLSEKGTCLNELEIVGNCMQV